MEDISQEITIPYQWMPEDRTEGNLSLFHVMDWYEQATGHYMNRL